MVAGPWPANRWPLPCGPQCCIWRKDAQQALERSGKDFRIAYTSSNATAHFERRTVRPGSGLPAGKRLAAGHAGDQ